MEELELHPDNIHKVFHKEWGEGALYYRPFEQPHKPIAFKDRTSEDLASCGYLPWTIKDTWNLICTRAHSTGEPGLFFIDEANKYNPIAHLGRIEATNPCGEIPMQEYDSCNLGSINLSKYYTESPARGIDYLKLQEDIEIAVRFLDNVIDANKYPIPEIEKMSKLTRRIGLGVMGFADLLFKLEIPYDTPGALNLAAKIGSVLSGSADKASSRLAQEKNVAPGLYGTNRIYRNAFRTTVAPTGTISIIANCSGGIEPIFALAFKRTVMPDASGKFKEMYEENEQWIKALNKVTDKFKREKIEKYVLSHGSLKGLMFDSPYEPIVDELFKVFVSFPIYFRYYLNRRVVW
jgi:ribonucleoside-diphosphate reductase alpha chain